MGLVPGACILHEPYGVPVDFIKVPMGSAIHGRFAAKGKLAVTEASNYRGGLQWCPYASRILPYRVVVSAVLWTHSTKYDNEISILYGIRESCPWIYSRPKMRFLQARRCHILPRLAEPDDTAFEILTQLWLKPSSAVCTFGILGLRV